MYMRPFKSRIPGIGPLAIALLFLYGCTDKTIEKRTYMANVPVYMSKEELNAGISSGTPADLETPGKIHVKDNIIYIVEPFSGIHVINNANPAAPQNTGYIKVPGVVDIASKGDILYADSYTDLVALNISDPLNVSEVSRTADVFEQVLPPTNNEYPLAEIDKSKGVVVGWKQEMITEETEVDNWSNPLWGELLMADKAQSGSQVLNVTFGNGKSGSMARFSVCQDVLYVADGRQIKVLDISAGGTPQQGATVQVDRDVETLFPMGDRLFVGTTSGMVIYSIANPSSPSYISNFNHSTSCDPVVVEGDYAYVTLRSGTMCGGWTNQLDVVNISDIGNPFPVRTYLMTNPHGLGIDNGTLFVCDGSDGLKVYDATDPALLSENMIGHFQDIQTYDVIPLGGVLLMVGGDGLYQYDYSDPANISLLSVIPVQ